MEAIFLQKEWFWSPGLYHFHKWKNMKHMQIFCCWTNSDKICSFVLVLFITSWKLREWLTMAMIITLQYQQSSSCEAWQRYIYNFCKLILFQNILVTTLYIVLKCQYIISLIFHYYWCQDYSLWFVILDSVTSFVPYFVLFDECLSFLLLMLHCYALGLPLSWSSFISSYQISSLSVVILSWSTITDHRNRIIPNKKLILLFSTA